MSNDNKMNKKAGTEKDICIIEKKNNIAILRNFSKKEEKVLANSKEVIQACKRFNVLNAKNIFGTYKVYTDIEDFMTLPCGINTVKEVLRLFIEEKSAVFGKIPTNSNLCNYEHKLGDVKLASCAELFPDIQLAKKNEDLYYLKIDIDLVRKKLSMTGLLDYLYPNLAEKNRYDELPVVFNHKGELKQNANLACRAVVAYGYHSGDNEDYSELNKKLKYDKNKVIVRYRCDWKENTKMFKAGLELLVPVLFKKLTMEELMLLCKSLSL